eukprot:SAG31_NODE_39103_length_291_cov_0.453125_1_plen_58_part_01
MASGWQWEDGSPWTSFRHKRTEMARLREGQHLVLVPTLGWHNTGELAATSAPAAPAAR